MMRIARGRATSLALLICTVAGCRADPETAHEPSSRPSSAAPIISVAACLDEAADEAACPNTLREEFQAAARTCRDAGGTIAPIDPPGIWTFDVNADGRQEIAFNFDSTIVCENAWSIFSCGSSECPKVLYEQQAGEWRSIGALYAPSIDAVELVEGGAGEYRDLRVGCGADMECTEHWNYVWKDDSYVRTTIDVRGHRVDFEGSVHGIYPLTANTALLTTPDAARAEVIERYAAGWDMVVVGTAIAADYYYVSPCNACEKGFVPKSALRVQ